MTFLSDQEGSTLMQQAMTDFAAMLPPEVHAHFMLFAINLVGEGALSVTSDLPIGAFIPVMTQWIAERGNPGPVPIPSRLVVEDSVSAMEELANGENPHPMRLAACLGGLLMHTMQVDPTVRHEFGERLTAMFAHMKASSQAATIAGRTRAARPPLS